MFVFWLLRQYDLLKGWMEKGLIGDVKYLCVQEVVPVDLVHRSAAVGKGQHDVFTLIPEVIDQNKGGVLSPAPSPSNHQFQSGISLPCRPAPLPAGFRLEWHAWQPSYERHQSVISW